MRKLVLIFKDLSDNQLSIKEYNIESDIGKYYIFNVTNRYFSKEGVLKKYVNRICTLDTYPNTYPVELPYIVGQYWKKFVFMFVNKNKYEQNPIEYINMIKNYTN